MEHNDVGSWEQVYREGRDFNIAPYTEVFSFLAKRFGQNAENAKLLEIGCGVGNNLLFARWAMGFEIHGIDFSQIAIDEAKRRFDEKGLSYGSLKVGDVRKLPYADGEFDAVVERGVLQCNTLPLIERITAEVFRVLKPGGHFCAGVAGEDHPRFGAGKYLGNGSFDNPEFDGVRHFFARRDLLQVFAPFETTRVYKTITQELPSHAIAQTVWHVEMRKPA